MASNAKAMRFEKKCYVIPPKRNLGRKSKRPKTVEVPTNSPLLSQDCKNGTGLEEA